MGFKNALNMVLIYKMPNLDGRIILNGAGLRCPKDAKTFLSLFVYGPVLHTFLGKLGLGSLLKTAKLPQKETIFQKRLLTPI